MQMRFLRMMASKYKEDFIKKIEKQLSTIKTNLVHLSFEIDHTSNKNLNEILQHAFVLTSYGYLEGFFKNTLTDYLHFLQKYQEQNPSSQLSCSLYYFYRFSNQLKKDSKFAKIVTAYFNKIFNGKNIITTTKEANPELSNFIASCNNNMKYDVMLLLLHLFSLDLRNYEKFIDNNKKEYSTEMYLNALVSDRNALAHGEIGCLLGTFSLHNDYTIYKSLVIYLVDCLKNEITDIIVNDYYLKK